MEFSSIDEMIEFGSIEIQYIPEYEKKKKHRKRETINERRID
jgi:hypothetical protein